MQFNLEIPLNSLSLGQIGYGVAYEMFRRGLAPNIFPVGNVDLRAFNQDTNFEYWLNSCVKKAISNFQGFPTIKHWHISGSERRLGKGKQVLWTAHECSEITPAEQEVCRGYDVVLVTSNYSKEVFAKGGIEAQVCPNYFDELHFKEIEVPSPDDAIQWGLFGKLEKRKHTRNSIIAWANKYGNNKNHRLVAVIFNPFLQPEMQQHEINSWFGGRIPWNIQILPFQEKNSDLNKVFNSVDIVVALSGAEGWNLPLSTCLGLGKHAVVLNCTGHKDFANDANSVLVEPSGQEPIYDGVFFHQGGAVNQGNMYSFDIAAAHAAFDWAIARFKDQHDNISGRRIRENFTVAKTVDKLLEQIS